MTFSMTMLTLIGMRQGTFHPLSFLDRTLSADFLPKISELFWRPSWAIYGPLDPSYLEDNMDFLLYVSKARLICNLHTIMALGPLQVRLNLVFVGIIIDDDTNINEL